MTTAESDTASLNRDEITCVEISDAAVMDKRPLVSVHMLTYNHEPYIAQAIEGVLIQKTDFPIELVIGEDCSTDRTREIVLAYQRKHPDVIRVVLWDKNVGARRNSRKLNELLRGKYVALNEGDDYWIHPKKLQMQVDIMEADPKVGLVHGGADMYHVARGRRHPWKPKPSDYDDGDIFHKYMNGKYFVFTATACVRMDLYRAVLRDNPDGWDRRFLMGDTQLWLELSRVTRFKLINEPLAIYGMLPESAVRSRDIRKEIRFWKSNFEMLMHYVHKYNAGTATRRYLRNSYARQFLYYACMSGDCELADEAWRELTDVNAHMRLSDRVYRVGAKHASIRPAIRVIRRFAKFLVHPQA